MSSDIEKRAQTLTEAIDLVEEATDPVTAEQIVMAIEHLTNGVPIAKVAKLLDVDKKTILGWLRDVPGTADAIRLGKGNLDDWRAELLRRQYSIAAAISMQLLTLDEDLLAYPPKLLTIIQRQANTILSMAGSKNIEAHDDTSEAVLSATATALDYLAQRLNERPVAQPEVRVVIPGGFSKEDDTLLENGVPEFGVFGSVDHTEDGFVCHICGREFRDLFTHVTKGHKIKAGIYEGTYLLSEGTLKECQE